MTVATSPFAEMEQGFCQARGVARVRIAREKTGQLAIHVLANGERTPKQIVRDLKAIAQTVFQLELDHRFISIAEPKLEMELDEDALRKIPRTRRIVISNVSVEPGASVVELARGKDSITGKCINERLDEYSLVAAAVLDGLRQIEDSFARISVLAAHVTGSDSSEVATVVIGISSNEEVKHSAGCALVRELGQHVAIARATLDATNRRIASVKH